MKKTLDLPRPVHPFPARMAPELALRHLDYDKPVRVLDPMMGSGTVARLALERGHRAVGFDTDPLAILVAETWCRPVNPDRLLKAARRVVEGCGDWCSVRASDAYPKGASKETRKFVRYWFDLRARRQLSVLLREIKKENDRLIRLHLLTAVSRTVIVKEGGVSLARDASHSRPHRSYDAGPISPIKAFQRSTKALARGLEKLDRKINLQVPQIRKADARKLPLRRHSVDVVISSPPYLNAIDYLRGHKLSLVWLGYQVEKLRHLRSTNIGAESGSNIDDDSDILKGVVNKKSLPTREQRMLHRYARDVASFVGEMWRVIRPGGICVLVVGDSNLKGAYVRNSRIVRNAALNAGFNLKSSYRRRIPNHKRYLPPPGSSSAGEELTRRMRTEVVLVFKKRKAEKKP